ncbi:predicted protein [Nematostella vectensis]|uniref:Retinoblastoma-like protein 1 n=1 Tax=Nematostella vectensis TaxID=45351 RepID=A7RQ05_NEMVE|nr:retinoblastoma-like protein 1 isoform X2 [Nematostella vectensis]EDO46411.1 predicted protein [Nematostella vectensis]|eukprot:XP_001638474.1 predicted protein [Nematostella vectensis]
MASSNEDEDTITKERFDNVCSELNMDEETAESAWSSYETIRTNYTLEGDSLHWLACALYVACRRSVVPTVDSSGTVEGNCVSLTRLLRASKLSLIQFFSKMKKWLDMSNASSEFRKKIEHLERNFQVSTVIFNKYRPIFLDLFKNPSEDTPKAQRSRKSRKQPCSISDVFSFCWTLYVEAKGNFPAISDDLVNSYHLLLCCLDLMYSNALAARHRRDLINTEFEGLPSDFNTRDVRGPSDAPCIVDVLCTKYQGIVLEAKSIKEHYWKPFVQKLFEKRVLRGHEESLSGILDLGNFEANWKAINKEYEEYVLSAGDFDERIFLGEEAHIEIGTPAKLFGSSEVDECQKSGLKKNLQEHFSKTRSLAPQTPLTGRRYLKEKDPCITPVSTATQSVSRLQAMCSGLKPTPSERLLTIFKECSRDPLQSIIDRVENLGEIFLKEYVQPSAERPNSPCSTREFALRRLKLAEILYYKVLENITLSEKRRLQGHLDLTTLLEQDVFHRSLLACCLEIVIFSYNSQRTFPWVISILGLAPYYFYKVIESLIKAEDGLSRDVVKHLNHIEEQVLESLAWSGDSPLWMTIEQAGGVPSCEDVTIPNHVEAAHPNQNLLASPIMHPRLQRICGEEGMPRRIMSPTSPTLQDHFGSPGASGARRNLMANFGGAPARTVAMATASNGHFTRSAGAAQAASNSTASVSQVHPGTTPTLLITQAPASGGGFVVNGIAQAVVLPSSTATTVQVSLSPRSGSTLATSVIPPGSPVRSPVRLTPQAAVATSHSASTTPAKPKKTGSLALFFRKVYHMASVRLRDLCARLDVNEELRGKMWTCFEHSLMHLPEIAKDRHLDQILMCCVYVMGKVTNSELSFQNIMKCYRTQPQAASHVYRSVMIKNRRRAPIPNTGSESSRGDSGSTRTSPIRSTSTIPSTPPPPGGSSSTENSPVLETERGDLIEFYNKVFIKTIKNFALKFSSSDRSLESPPLSPLPIVRNQGHSPRRQVSARHPVYISPHKNGVPMTPTTRMLYCFSESPAKNLRDINHMLRQGENRKRALLQDDIGAPQAKRSTSEEHLQRRLTSMIEERQANASR